MILQLHLPDRMENQWDITSNIYEIDIIFFVAVYYISVRVY